MSKTADRIIKQHKTGFDEEHEPKKPACLLLGQQVENTPQTGISLCHGGLAPARDTLSAAACVA